MDRLTEIIQSLNKQEARNFKIFEKRIGADKFEKKMLKLYDYIRSGKYEEHDDSLVTKLYPPNNKNAYYRLKNRLINNLQKSLIEFHLGVDKRMTVLGTIMLARIFYYKANYKLSFFYLQKAEKQAIDSGSYNLLNLIYDEIISLSKYYYEINPQHYIDLKAQRNQEYAGIQQVEYLLANINYQLHRTNFSGLGTNVLEELERLQEQFKLLPQDQTEAVKIEINRVVRSILQQKKDYVSLESYLKESYRNFNKEGFFNKSNHREKIILLVWIINTLNKIGKFKEAESRLEELNDALLDFNKLYYNNYIWTYYMALVANWSSSDQNEKAIELLEDLKSRNDESLSYYTPYIYISLVTFYFNVANFDKATRNLNHLLHTSAYQSLSHPIRLGLSVAEIMIRIDQEDWNYAHLRLKTLKRSLRTVIGKDENAQEKAFISILSMIVTEPDAFKQEKIKKRIQNFLESAKQEVGSSSSPIDYIAWLNAKLEEKSYYETFLALNRLESPERGE